MNLLLKLVSMGLAALTLSSVAQAQTCTQVPQRITGGNLSTTSNQLNGWSGSGWQTFSLGGVTATNHGAQLWNDGTDDGDQFALTTTATNSPNKVSGGAILEFWVAWNNASYGAYPAGANADAHLVFDGNQFRLQVLYSGTVYVTLLTARVDGRANNTADANDYSDWGPTDSSLTVNNGALFLNAPPSSPPPSYVGGRGNLQFRTPVVNWTQVRIQLPDNVAQAGSVQLLATRMESTFSASPRSDDLYVKDMTINDRTLCLVKSTPAGPGGTFGFSISNVDTNQAVAGNQAAASIITTGPTNVAFDGDSVSGVQPMLVNDTAVVATETPAAGYALSAVSCDSNASATIGPANTAVFDNLTPGVMTTCTIVNSPSSDLSITKTNTPAAGANDQPADTLVSGTATTYDIVVSNATASATVVNAILRDSAPTGAANCVLGAPACAVTTGTATCPTVGAAAGQLSVANLQGSGGVLIPSMNAGSSLTFKLTCTVQ